MLKSLLFASLALGFTTSTTSTAVADSSANAPRQPPPMMGVCVPASGGVVFEIDTASRDLTPLTTTTFKLYANGTWTYAETRDGKVTTGSTSCIFNHGTVKQLHDQLAKAPWKTTMQKYRCMAVSMGYTEYRVDGKLVLHREMCDGLILDAASEKALADANKLVRSLGTPPTPSPAM